jgi:PKD repeat protein
MTICLVLVLPAAAGATPTWLAPSALSSTSAEFADTAMGPEGGAAVTWLGPGQVVQVAASPPLGGFSAPLDLSPAGENRAPQVAVDGAGDVTVVWYGSFGSNYLAQVATVTDGMPSSPVTLSATGKNAVFPTVAMNDRGDTIVAWTRGEGPGGIVQASFRPAGGAFGVPVSLSSGGETATDPRVAIDEAGDATVVWDRYNGVNEVVEEATRSAATGSFSKAAVLSNEAEPAIQPFVAMNAEGDTAVTWAGSNGADQLVQVALRPAGGTFGKAVSVSLEGANAAFPQVALDGRGDPSVVWTREFVVQYAAGTSSDTFAPTQSLAFLSWAPSIAEDPAGDTLVSYDNVQSNSAFAVVRPAEGRFGEPHEVSPAGQIVSPNGESDEQGLNAAIDGDGDGVVGFTIEGGEELPEVSLLDAGGPTLENVSIPAAATAGAPVTFSVSPADQVDPKPAVTWSFGDASTASGDTATHTFVDPGTYSVSVTATVAPGDSVAQTASIAVAAPASTTSGVPTFHVATLGSATVAADSRGRVHLRIDCPAGGAACAGTVTLTLPATASGLAVAARALGTAVIVAAGHASFGVAAGASTTVSVALPSAVLGLLSRHHRLTLVVAVESHGASDQSATTSAKVLVKAYAKPKRVKRKKKK